VRAIARRAGRGPAGGPRMTAAEYDAFFKANNNGRMPSATPESGCMPGSSGSRTAWSRGGSWTSRGSKECAISSHGRRSQGGVLKPRRHGEIPSETHSRSRT
jgi:hypothetical protein